MQTQGGRYLTITAAVRSAAAQSPVHQLASEILKIRHGRVLGERKKRHVRRAHLRVNHGRK